MNKVIDTSLLPIIAQVLRELNCQWWLDHGTLLGLYRDGRIIEWDLDVDFGLLYEKEIVPKLIYKLREKFNCAYYDLTCDAVKIKFVKDDMSWGIDLAFYRVEGDTAIKYWPVERRVVAVPLLTLATIFSGNRYQEKIRTLKNLIRVLFENVVSILPKKLSFAIAKYLIKKLEYKKTSAPLMYFADLGTLEYEGDLYNIPRLTEKYLEYRYGQSWRVPNPKWDHMVDDGGLR